MEREGGRGREGGKRRKAKQGGVESESEENTELKVTEKMRKIQIQGGT